jgi:hypothetical protein
MVGNEVRPIGERVAILETKINEMEHYLKDINDKLDELLHLKSKGMGALWLVSLLIGSGVLGLVALVSQLFNRPHL